MPLLDVCEGALLQILEYLSPTDLLSLGLVSKSLFLLTSRDHLWETHLRCLRGSWNLRHNYCIRLANTARSKKNAYWIDVNESYRPFLTMDDVSGIDSWNFRFKAAAGEMWQHICPWQRGFHAARVAFRPTGIKNGLLERLPSVDGQQLLGLGTMLFSRLLPSIPSLTHHPCIPIISAPHPFTFIVDNAVLLEWSLAWQTGTDPGCLISHRYDT